MKKQLIQLIAVCAFLTFSTNSFAQCDTIASLCSKHIGNQFISDGQQYRAMLISSEETAEFHTTFYGGSTYRIAACSGLKDGNLVFSVFDSEHNQLYTNIEYKNAPYWDFKITSTIDCIIEAKLDAANQGSGCAVILIGFKQ